jgi:hypothetical protein
MDWDICRSTDVDKFSPSRVRHLPQHIQVSFGCELTL